MQNWPSSNAALRRKPLSTRTKPKESSFSTHSFLSLKTRSTVFHTSFSGEYGERT